MTIDDPTRLDDLCLSKTESMTFDRQTNKPKIMKPWMELATSEMIKKLVELASNIQLAASIDHVSPIKRNSLR